MTKPQLEIYQGDNKIFLHKLPSEKFALIYIDPPFNTGKQQSLGSHSYGDSICDYMAFLEWRLIQARRLLTANGSLFLHLDYREVHYAKIMLDTVFGRESFINEIIWAYDYGARSKRKWSTKHDNILWYVKDPNDYTFNFDAMDRIPYMAPGLVGPEKAARGKTPTDCWWHTIVPTNGKERTGYPTQKPLGILNRIVRVHSNPGDWTMDFFAGSGSFGESAIRSGRNCVLIDENPEAVQVMAKRLAFATPQFPTI